MNNKIVENANLNGCPVDTLRNHHWKICSSRLGIYEFCSYTALCIIV